MSVAIWIWATFSYFVILGGIEGAMVDFEKKLNRNPRDLTRTAGTFSTDRA